MAPEFLCYRPAHVALQEGAITEEQYYHHVFQHLIWEHNCKGQSPVTEDVLGGEIKHLIAQSWQTVADTTPFEQIFPASRRGHGEFSSALASVPQSFREPWYRSIAYLALKERDAATLKWALEGCKEQFSDRFEWEAYAVKQSQERDEKARDCWEMLKEWGFEEPAHWRGKNPMRVVKDEMY